MTDLSPAAQKLLRELARRDKGEGVAVRYAGRGRWNLDHSTDSYNRATYWPLFEAELVTGWDEYDDDGPLRLTTAGQKLAAELEQQAAAQEAVKKARPKPTAESPSAIRALRALAGLPQPVRPYSGDRRGIWSLGGRDGYSARELTFYALEDAGYVRVIRGAHLGRHIEITDAGRKRIA